MRRLALILALLPALAQAAITTPNACGAQGLIGFASNWPAVPTVADNDVAIMVIQTPNLVTHVINTNGAGWTNFATCTDAAAGLRFSLWRKVVSGGALAQPQFLTSTYTDQGSVARICAFRGVNTTSPIDNIGTCRVNGSGNDVAFDNLTTTTSGAAVVASAGRAGAVSNWFVSNAGTVPTLSTIGTGTTGTIGTANGLDNSHGWGWRILASPGSTSQTFHSDGSLTQSVTLLWSLRDAAAPAANDPPTFNPVAGPYAAAQTVTVACPNGGSPYCTLDGSTPTSGSTSCPAGSASVSVTATLKGICIGAPNGDSNVTSGDYSILPQASAPTFSPASGAIVSGASVTASSSTPAATIRCTHDGSAPGAGSAVTTSFAITSPETTKCYATASGYADSSVATTRFTLARPAGVQTYLSPTSQAFVSAGTASKVKDGLYGLDKNPGVDNRWNPGTASAWAALDVGSGPTQILVGISDEAPFADFQVAGGSGGGTTAPGFVSYTIETSSDSTNGSDGSWANVLTVTGNTYTYREHKIAFTGKNWVRISITEPSTCTTTGTRVSCIALDEIDVWDATSGTPDTFMWVGDSITARCSDRGTAGYGPGTPLSLQGLVQTVRSRHLLQIGAGQTGYATSNYDPGALLDTYLSTFPDVKYWGFGLGTNDSNANMADATYQAHYQAMIDKVKAAGRTPLLAKIPYTEVAGYSQATVRLNAVVDALATANGLVRGPDLYTPFQVNKDAYYTDGANNVTNNVHPNAVGCAAWQSIWAQSVLAGIYAQSSGASGFDRWRRVRMR